jgi:hypothetical protein
MISRQGRARAGHCLCLKREASLMRQRKPPHLAVADFTKEAVHEVLKQSECSVETCILRRPRVTM